MENKKGSRITTVIGFLLFASLALSVIYSFVKFIKAPESSTSTGIKVKTDYLLMLTQCVLGLAVMTLPRLVSRRGVMEIPPVMCVLFYIFLYCSIYLGEVRCFYYYVPHWDTVLHAVSGVMLGILGYMIANYFSKDSDSMMSPMFVALFVFCFSLAAGAVWEMYEFTGDAVLGLNMQKTRTEAGVGLAGTEALMDTMKDIIIDAVFGLVTAVYCFFSQKKRIRQSNDAIEYTETEERTEVSVRA